MEAKRLGDMAVTEGWAALFERLVDEPAWLNRRLDVPDIAKITNDGAVSTLYFLRRYSAKLLYEIEFFQADDPESMRPRYAELLTDALKLPANPESYLDDIDGSFYVTGYLRSWAFEAQLRDYPPLASSETSGSPDARPATSCASCGRSARARAPRSSCATSPAPGSRWRRSPSGPAKASAPRARRSMFRAPGVGPSECRDHLARPSRGLSTSGRPTEPLVVSASRSTSSSFPTRL